MQITMDFSASYDGENVLKGPEYCAAHICEYLLHSYDPLLRKCMITYIMLTVAMGQSSPW